MHIIWKLLLILLSVLFCAEEISADFDSLTWTKQTGTFLDDVGQGVFVSADGRSIYVSGYVSGSLNSQPFAGIYHC